MIARVKFGYPAQDVIGRVGNTDEGYAALKEILIPAPERERAGNAYAWPSDPLIDLETDGPKLIALGIEFVVVNFKNTLPLQALLPNGERYTVQVSIPNVGLLSIRAVKVCEDYCTDRLQQELDNGWNIIAVCPPNAARRPDYVLGRSTKEDE